MLTSDSANLAGFDLLPYQARTLDSPARFTWNCWARQTGKSFTFSMRRLVARTPRYGFSHSSTIC